MKTTIMNFNQFLISRGIAIFLFVFMCAGNVSANISWQVTGIALAGDECSMWNIVTYVDAPDVGPGSYYRYTLQRNNYGTWVTEAVKTTVPLVGYGYIPQPLHFYLDPTGSGGGDVSTPKLGNWQYRVKVDLYDGTSKKWIPGTPGITGPIYVWVPNSPELSENALFVEGSNGFEAVTEAVLVSRCDPDSYILDLIRPSDDYFGNSFSIWESDASGNKNTLQMSGQQATAPMPEDFHDFMCCNLGTSFNQLIRDPMGIYPTGYYLLELELGRACEPDPQIITMLFLVSDAPYIASFDFRWNEDANTTTGPNGGLEKIEYNSKNPNSYPSIGGISGYLWANINTSGFATYDVELFDATTQSDILVAAGYGNSVTQGTSEFYQNTSGGGITPLPGHAGDLPIDNEGTRYKIKLTLHSPECPSSSDWSYFEVGVGDRLKRAVSGHGVVDKELSIWHSTEFDTKKLMVNIDGGEKQVNGRATLNIIEV